MSNINGTAHDKYVKQKFSDYVAFFLLTRLSFPKGGDLNDGPFQAPPRCTMEIRNETNAGF